MRTIEEIKDYVADLGFEFAYKVLSIVKGIPLDRIQEICQAERDGRLMVLPCILGQKIWYAMNNKINYGFVEWFDTDNHKAWTVAVANPPCAPVFLRFEDFGETAFLTREEAEKALKGGAAK